MVDPAATRAMRQATAKQMRKAMLANLRRVVRDCTCEWPLAKYRNGHGHHPDCPAVDAARLGQEIERRSTRNGSPDGASA